MNTYYHFQRRKLKSWYSIIIETDKENESKYVFFTSKIHKTKKLKLPISFSLNLQINRYLMIVI